MSPNLICIDLCLARCSANWRVSRKHIVRASTSSLWTPNWFSAKNAFNIFVCQSYCGVRFVSFTLVPEFPTFAFRDFPRYLEFFVLENVYLRALFSSRNRWILREKEDIASVAYFELYFFVAVIWKLHSSLYSSGGISLTFRFLATSEIRSYHSRLFSSGWLPVVRSF